MDFLSEPEIVILRSKKPDWIAPIWLFMIQLAALQSIQIIFFRVFQRVTKGYFP